MKWPINTNQVPPGGWTVDIEGCGPTVQSYSFVDWIKQVSLRLQANGRDKNGWREFWVNEMCEQRPDIPSEDKDAPPVRAMTGDDVLRFLKTMWVTKEQGFSPVSEELQNKRISTCLACPKIGYISCFVGCQTITASVIHFLTGRKIERHPEVLKKSCLCCGCPCEVKTLWPLDILKEVDERMGTDPQYDKNCWVLSESQEPKNIPPTEI